MISSVNIRSLVFGFVLLFGMVGCSSDASMLKTFQDELSRSSSTWESKTLTTYRLKCVQAVWKENGDTYWFSCALPGQYGDGKRVSVDDSGKDPNDIPAGELLARVVFEEHHNIVEVRFRKGSVSSEKQQLIRRKVTEFYSAASKAFGN